MEQLLLQVTRSPSLGRARGAGQYLGNRELPSVGWEGAVTYQRRVAVFTVPLAICTWVSFGKAGLGVKVSPIAHSSLSRGRAYLPAPTALP